MSREVTARSRAPLRQAGLHPSHVRTSGYESLTAHTQSTDAHAHTHTHTHTHTDSLAEGTYSDPVIVLLGVLTGSA